MALGDYFAVDRTTAWASTRISAEKRHYFTTNKALKSLRHTTSSGYEIASLV
jgi:hypothetical protein